jgi:hypothetical protein
MNDWPAAMTNNHAAYPVTVWHHEDGEGVARDFLRIENLTTNQVVAWASDWRMAQQVMEAMEK